MFNKDNIWIDIADNKNKLIIKGNKIEAKIYGETNKSTYTTEKHFDNNIKIVIKTLPYEYLIKSQEIINNQEVEIISGIIMEYDGRGPIVMDEYVKKEDLKKVPKDFKSKVYHSHNNIETQPTYITE